MTNVSQFPNRQRVQEEAAQWLIKLDGDVPPNKRELEALREWLSRSPMHRQELRELNAFWENNVLTELVVPLGGHEASENPGEKVWLWMRSLQGIAAAVFLTVFTTFLYVYMEAPQIETNGLYSTAVGQQRRVTLADGSVMQLNTNSQVEVKYNDGYRDIYLLQGEVHFEVAKETDWPFSVYAGVGRVTAVGTAFSIHLTAQDVDILVTEGQVALDTIAPPKGGMSKVSNSPAGSSTTQTSNVLGRVGLLTEGHSITLNTDDVIQSAADNLLDVVEVVSPDKLKVRQAWREGMLVFSGETLEQVVSEINRYSTVSIEITDPEVSKIRIGGRFKVGDVDNMLNVLEANFGLEVERLSYNRAKLKLTK